MWQRAILVFALLLMLAASAGWGQTPEMPAPSPGAAWEEPAPESEGTEAGQGSLDEVPGEAAIELAQFISAYLAQTGQVPDLAQARTTAGSLRALSAAEVFALLVRTVYLWRANGELPATVPIAPVGLSGPDLEAEDLAAGPVDQEGGQELPTEAFLAHVEATVRWVDDLRKVPTAVWVQGERLSAAQYLGGLAVCLEYAYFEGGLLDTVSLPAYAPPQSWAPAGTEGASDESGEAEQEWAEGSEQEAGEVETLLPVAPAEPARGLWAAGPPQLAVFPEPGATLSGRVDVVASYSGPAPTFVVFEVDNVVRAIMNLTPYSFRWDATAVAPGMHTVRVQVYGEGGLVMSEQVSAYIIEAPQGEAVGEQPEETF